MSKMDDLNAQIVQVGVEVGKHMDAMDSSINTEIVNAQNSITTALANSGASDAQIQAASVALGTLQDAINGHIDTSKAKVDAAFPTPPAAS